MGALTDRPDCTEANRIAQALGQRPRKKVRVDHSRTKPFAGPELAAFMIMLFRLEKPAGGPEDSWDDQLCRLANLVKDPGDLRDRIHLVIAMSKDDEIRPLVNKAHQALLDLFTAVHESGDWGDCKVLSTEQFFTIANL